MYYEVIKLANSVEVGLENYGDNTYGELYADGSKISGINNLLYNISTLKVVLKNSGYFQVMHNNADITNQFNQISNTEYTYDTTGDYLSGIFKVYFFGGPKIRYQTAVAVSKLFIQKSDGRFVDVTDKLLNL